MVMFNGLGGNGYQPLPTTDEFSGWDEGVRGKRMSDVVYGDIKREVNYLYTLVGKLKDCGEYCKAVELEDSLNSLMKLCDLGEQ